MRCHVRRSLAPKASSSPNRFVGMRATRPAVEDLRKNRLQARKRIRLPGRFPDPLAGSTLPPKVHPALTTLGYCDAATPPRVERPILRHNIQVWSRLDVP